VSGVDWYDARPSYVETWTYDGPEGLSGTVEIDDNGDGRADTIRTERFDEAGRTIELHETLDAWAGGPPELEATYTWDDEGRLVAAAGVRALADQPWRVEFDRTYDYDDRGRLVQRSETTQVEGTSDEVLSVERWEPTCP
jgi:hypothetical protein